MSAWEGFLEVLYTLMNYILQWNETEWLILSIGVVAVIYGLSVLFNWPRQAKENVLKQLRLRDTEREAEQLSFQQMLKRQRQKDKQKDL